MDEAHRQRSRGGEKGLRKQIKEPQTCRRRWQSTWFGGTREHRGQSAEGRAGEGAALGGHWRPGKEVSLPWGWEQIAKG